MKVLCGTVLALAWTWAACAQTNGEWTANRLPGTNRVWTAERTRSEIAAAETVATQQVALAVAGLSSHTGNAVIHLSDAQAEKIAASLTNETDEAALAALATNRTTIVFNPTNANEWTDGAGDKWRVDVVYSNFWRVTAEEIGLTNDFVFANPIPGNVSVSSGGFTLTSELFYGWENNPYVQVLLRAPAFDMSWVSSGVVEGSMVSSVSLEPFFGPTTPATMDWTTVLLSVTTSHVGTVALESSLTGLATTQQVAKAVAPLATTQQLESAISALRDSGVMRWSDSADSNSWWTAASNVLSKYELGVDSEWMGWSTTNPAVKYPVYGIADGPIYDDPPIMSDPWWFVGGSVTGTLYASFGSIILNVTFPESEQGYVSPTGGVVGSYSVYYIEIPVTNRTDYTLSTGNLWQAIAAVDAVASNALAEADGVAAWATNHTTAPNPHPGLATTQQVAAVIALIPDISGLATMTNAPAWLVYSNITDSVTVTNLAERPVKIYGGAGVTGLVSFAALREPLPLYVEVQGFLALGFPGAYTVGGGAWQTNQVNIYQVWLSGTNILVNPITAREIY